MGAPNELSFLPDDYLERKARRRTNVICSILFCVVVAAIGGAFTVTERSMRDLERQTADVQAQYTDAARRIEQVQKMQEKQRTMAHQAELTASLLEKVPRTFILAEITNGIPDGISLLDFVLNSSLSTTPAPVAKTAFELRKSEIDGASNVTALAAKPRVYDVAMKLTGVANNDGQVSQLISKLNQSTMFQDVNLIFTDEFQQADDKERKLRKFQIEMKLNPGAQVDTSTTPRLKSQATVQLEQQ